MSEPVQPVSLSADSEALHITWSDGLIQRLRWSFLREKCPCATCRVRRDTPPKPPPLFQILKPEEAQPIRGSGIQPVGNYAYHINFSDGHNTGIYSLELLHEFGAGG